MQVQIPFNGFYGSRIDDEIDNAIEREIEENPALADAFNSPNPPIDHPRLRATLAAVYVSEFADYVKENCIFETASGARYTPGIRPVFEYVDSPREYNFYNDLIVADVNPNSIKAAIFACLCEDNGVTLRERISEELAERSGFIPFYSANIDNWGIGELSPENVLSWEVGQLTAAQVRLILEGMLATFTDDATYAIEERVIDSMHGNGTVAEYITL